MPALSVHNRVSIVMMSILVVSVLMFVLSLGCGDDNPTGDTNPDDTGTIGPEGGTVTATNGASVVIPAGALSSGIEITIDGCDEGELPDDLGILPYIGAVDLGPNGQTFALPVTITIPCPTPLTPGSQFPLFYYDETNSRWVQTTFTATVNADGLSYTGQVDHFSYWTSGNLPPGGLLGDFQDDLGDGSNAQAAFSAYQAYFQSEIASIGEKGVRNGQCHEVVGLHFDLTYKIDGVSGSLYQPYGQTTGNVFMVGYTFDRVTLSSDTFFDMFVSVFFKCSPDMALTANPASIDIGEESTVTATLTCDGSPMSGRTISLEAAGGMGTLDPTAPSTNGSGQATSTFTATDDGREAVLASYVTCQGKENQGTLIKSTYIEIGDEWSGTMNLTFHHSGESVPWVFNDIVTINFDLTIDEGNITGTGTGSHSASATSTHEVCTIINMNAPAFEVAVSGTAGEESFDFQVIPVSLPLVFTTYCEADPPVTMPVQAYSNIEASIIGQSIFINVAKEDGATDSGSGSEGFGEDIPVDYTYSVTMQSGS